MTGLKLMIAIVASVAVALIVLRLAFPLPPMSATRGPVVQPATQGFLAERATSVGSLHPGLSGVHLLPGSEAAFAARMVLAREAAATIDVQYYIWHADLTGLLLLDELRKAADRGVSVRMLLDDNGIDGLDPILSELDAHPNISIRLYNPFTIRRFKRLAYGFDFPRLNRRMHNKSFTADGVATIGGGRNIGDEYFGTAAISNYVDLDIFVVGDVVQSVSNDFASYWNSRSAYDFADVIGAVGPPDDATLRVALARESEDERLSAYRAAIGRDETVGKLIRGSLPLEWTHTRLVSDPPAKTTGDAGDAQLLAGQFDQLLGQAKRKLDIVSPYFVPGERGTRHLLALAGRGVRVRILTNSQDATDVMPVHAGYAKYRRRLLEGGVELYELKAGRAPDAKTANLGPLGSSSASLHAKTFAVDGEQVYVGSFNFDPRSVSLNTEMGFLVASQRIAGDMHDKFDDELATSAYTVSLTQSGDLRWAERNERGEERAFLHDPHTTTLSRLIIRVIGWLPIQWLL